jgi:hypothetical protein
MDRRVHSSPEYPDVPSKQNDCEMRILGCDSNGSGSIVDDDVL